MPNKRYKRYPPFPTWYIKEYESYLADMARDGQRFAGQNYFTADESRQITYRIMRGPVTLDDAILTKLGADGWSYVGRLNRIWLVKTCFHVFAAEDTNVSSSFFSDFLGSTVKSLKNIKLELLGTIFAFTAGVLALTAIFWRSFFFTGLATRTPGEVMVVGYLLVDRILEIWSDYAAKKHLKETYEQSGPSYVPLDWRQLKRRLKANRLKQGVLTTAVYIAIYFLSKTLWA